MHSNADSFYFGKIPSRSDFVRSDSGAQVIGLMDQWIAHGMEMLMSMPDWKSSFDSAGPFDFMFLGLKRKHAIHGVMASSRDASARRFPLVAATSFKLAEPLQFLRIAPWALEEASRSRRSLLRYATETPGDHSCLDLLKSRMPEFNLDLQAASLRCASCLAAHSVASLSMMLVSDLHAASLRRMVLTLGSLLLPLRAKSLAVPQKAIVLPLPRLEVERIDAIVFWLHLVSISLSGTTVELSLFSGMHLGNPRLIIAFNGVTPLIFKSLFDEETAGNSLIDLSKARLEEHDDFVPPSHAVLSSHLEHENLSALQLVSSFRECFG